MRRHFGYRLFYKFVEYNAAHVQIVRGLWTWVFLFCVKMYVRLLLFLLRRSVFRYIPVISMWLVYFYRTWQEEDPRNEWVEDWEEVLMIPYNEMDWRVIKWTIINTFDLGHVEEDKDQWDEFGSYEWFFHWTRPHLREVWFHVKLPLVRPSQVGAAPIAWIDRIECFTEWIYVDLWENVYYLWIPLDPRLIGAYFLFGFYFTCYLVRCTRKYGDYMHWDYVEERPPRPRRKPRGHGLSNRYESVRRSPLRNATWRVCSRHRFSVQRAPVRRLPKSRRVWLRIRGRLVRSCYDRGFRVLVHYRCHGNFLPLRAKGA